MIQIDSNYSFEYSLNGIEISHIGSSHFQIDATWGPAHQSQSVYDLSDYNLSTLAGVTPHLTGSYFVFHPTYQANSNSYNRMVNGQIDPVREFGYTLLSVEENGTGNWVETKSSNTSFLKSADIQALIEEQALQPVGKVGVERNENNFSTEPNPYAYSVIFEKAFSGEFALFLDRGGPIGSGWMWAKWFGYYYANEFPWIYHENLGWSYVEQNSTEDVWLHRQHLGWAWTNPDTFPYLWRFGHDQNDTQTWTFLERQASSTTLYDFSQKEWFDLNQPYTVSALINPQTGGTITGAGPYFRWQRASLEALPSENYKFLSWSGDYNSTANKVEFEILSDLSLHASFLPESPASLSTEDRMQQFEEILSIRDDLTPLQKEKAILEYLFYGNSPTAGIP